MVKRIHVTVMISSHMEADQKSKRLVGPSNISDDRILFCPNLQTQFQFLAMNVYQYQYVMKQSVRYCIFSFIYLLMIS